MFQKLKYSTDQKKSNRERVTERILFPFHMDYHSCSESVLQMHSMLGFFLSVMYKEKNYVVKLEFPGEFKLKNTTHGKDIL